jgi:hypothetical protein
MKTTNSKEDIHLHSGQFTRKYFQAPGKGKKGEGEHVIRDRQHRSDQREPLLNEIYCRGHRQRYGGQRDSGGLDDMREKNVLITYQNISHLALLSMNDCTNTVLESSNGYTHHLGEISDTQGMLDLV